MIKFIFLLLALTAFTGASKLPLTHPNGRIVGGHDVDIEDYPHQLDVQVTNPIYPCGAVIINSNWALTTTVCVFDKEPEEITFYAGSSIKGNSSSAHQGTNITMHPEHDGLDYDFALVRVDPPFDLGSPGIDAAALATSEPEEGTITTVTGWGSDANESMPLQLQAADLIVIDGDKCSELYDIFTESTICVDSSGKGPCYGDNGDPLIDKETGELYGISSGGIFCGDPKYPSVYSNIAFVRDWILEVTEDEE